MPALIEEYKEAKEQGRKPDEVLHLMHLRGLTITEAIKAFMNIYKVPLGEAKEQVSGSPFWREIEKAAEPLHEQIAESFRPDSNRA
jgi:hypothetical protein